GIRRSGKPTMDIGEAFLRKTGTFARRSATRFTVGNRLTPFVGRIQAWREAALPDARSGFLLGLENLPALVHAGLQVEVMRAAKLAGILVLGIGRLLKRVRRAAHATPRGRCFSTGNGHVGVL